MIVSFLSAFSRLKMGGPSLVFSLTFMAFFARGLPTTKETISRSLQFEEEGPPPIEASRWPSLAEVITKAGNGIKPSASLLDILNSDHQSVSKERKIRNSSPTSTLSTATSLTTIEHRQHQQQQQQQQQHEQEVPATVFDVSDFGITDIGWNEDNIKLDFITGKKNNFFSILIFNWFGNYILIASIRISAFLWFYIKGTHMIA